MNEDDGKAKTEGGGLSMLPSGRLCWDLAPFDRCFEQGMGSGLFALATAAWPAEADAAAFFLRSLVRDALTRLAHAVAENPEDDLSSLDVVFPVPASLPGVIDRFPPMKGGEYLSASVIRWWFEDFRNHIGLQLRNDATSLRQWLAHLGEPWSRIGRVFFHLAENRDDETGKLPFAFLATFAHRSTSNGELSHLPLGRAVQLYRDDHRALLALLQPLNEAARQVPMLKAMLADRSVYAPMAWDAEQARSFLMSVPLLEEAGIIVRMVNLWKKEPKKLQLAVTVDQQDGRENSRLGIHSILSFSVAATLGGRPLSSEELEQLLASDGGLLRFNGEWIDADTVKIRQLLDRWHQAAGMLNRLGIPMVQGLRFLVNGPNGQLPALPPEDPDCHVLRGERLEHALVQLGSLADDRSLLLSPGLQRILRPYQREGVSFLDRTTKMGFGACLADDMGLGKTLQCLAWLSHLKATGGLLSMPALIVAPASLLGNWQEEARRFTPELRSVILHPAVLQQEDWRRIAHDPKEWLGAYDLVITSYNMAARLEWLATIDFAALVIDEAQAVKNALARRTEAIRSLHAPRKVALSGTPVENSLSELWSLMDILNPGLLGDRKDFDRFVQSMGNDYSRLRRLVHPFMLRRMKTDPTLVPDLPDKTEMAGYCLLTPRQAALYKAQVNMLHAVLDEPDPASRVMLILPFLSRFKQICNHPAQFLGRGEYGVEDSGKFMLLRELASSIAQRQEKMIVFTQFRAMMDPLHHLLATLFGRQGLMLHGGTAVPERGRLVEAFQREDGPPYFVLSLKAAGTGLTLTQANHVVHFDRWWNPAVENQATDRAYRIGQHRNVLVHRLICRGTIEDRIDRMLEEKRDLAHSLFEGVVEKLLADMTPDEIMGLFA